MKRPRAAKAKARPLLALAAAILAILFGAEAAAHEVGLSRGEYTLAGATITAQVTFARREVIGLCAGLDADHDGALTAAEIDHALDAIQGAVVGRIKVRGDGVACPGKLDSAALAEEDGLTLHASYTCPTAPHEAAIELALLEDLPFGHRHVARSSSASAASDAILSQRSRSFSIVAGSATEPAAERAPPALTLAGMLSFYTLGIEHILKGYDHLVFLLGLVLVGGRFRSLLWVITAFTIAHSITLGMAVLGVWAPSPRFVEPAIALSIAYVGVENFFVKDAEKRWRITFPFGLVHGFGFAGALKEVAMPRGDVPAALVLFNLGVESGQLAVLALVLPLVIYARKRPSFRDRGVKLISAAIVVAGLIWFVSRAFGG